MFDRVLNTPVRSIYHFTILLIQNHLKKDTVSKNPEWTYISSKKRYTGFDCFSRIKGWIYLTILTKLTAQLITSRTLYCFLICKQDGHCFLVYLLFLGGMNSIQKLFQHKDEIHHLLILQSTVYTFFSSLLFKSMRRILSVLGWSM